MIKKALAALKRYVGDLTAPIPDELPHALVSALMIAQQNGAVEVDGAAGKRASVVLTQTGSVVTIKDSGRMQNPYLISVMDPRGNPVKQCQDWNGENVQEYPYAGKLSDLVGEVKQWGALSHPTGPFVSRLAAMREKTPQQCHRRAPETQLP